MVITIQPRIHLEGKLIVLGFRHRMDSLSWNRILTYNETKPCNHFREQQVGLRLGNIHSIFGDILGHFKCRKNEILLKYRNVARFRELTPKDLPSKSLSSMCDILRDRKSVV